MARRRILEKYNGYKLEWLNDSLSFIVLIAAVFILFRFVIGLSVIGGDSMVIYSRLDRQLSQGDVISMRVPSGEYYVKRVIAVGGDVVDLRGGRVYVNGELLEEPWAMGETQEEYGAVVYPYTVREGNVFVLGDNRVVSMDSRTFGEVNLRQIKGTIILQIGRWYIRRVNAVS